MNRAPQLSLMLATSIALACGDEAGNGSGVDGGADAGAVPDADAAPDPTRALVTLRVGVPRSTPPGSRVFVMGDFNAWDPADPDYELTPVYPLGYAIDLDLPLGERITYRFTRGSDELLELGKNKAEMDDRTLDADQTMIRELVVETWADTVLRLSTVRGNIRIIEVPNFIEGRRVWVYLPPGYNEELERRYPVLYMMDGQNVFEVATSFAGEWRVDEACEQLIPEGEVEPLIVVAIDNGELNRITEYTPFVDPDYGGGGADAFLQSIIDTVVPYVNSQYRTRTGPEDTGFSGSSLGGLISMFTAYTAPEVFGKIGAVSTSIWYADRELLDFVEARSKPNVRLWTDMGTMEGRTAVDNLRDLEAILLEQGFVEAEDLRVVVDEGAEHNELAWSSRMPDILRFLFPAD